MPSTEYLPEMREDTVILIPAYDPSPAMIDTARELSELGLAVVIVNDGSHASAAPLFEAAAQYATVIGYEKNGGKGHALKYGIRHLVENCPACRYFVTADADGQHAVADILRCVALVHTAPGFVIGSREFTGEVPFRSRFGNSLSRISYAMLADRYLRDNQSGLRGFPMSLAAWQMAIPGERYDYEMNVLMYAARQNVRINELHMSTIYESGNPTSHFDPLRDTLRLHRRILLGSVPSLIGAAVSLLLYLILVGWMGNRLFGFRFAVLTAGSVGLAVGEFLTWVRYRRVADVPMHANFMRFICRVFRLAAFQTLLELLAFWLKWPFLAALILTAAVELTGEYWLKKCLARWRHHIYH